MEVKWIKITTNMFEDEKIDFIESLPEADTILMIWIKLLTLAGKVNDGGLIYLTAEIPYTDQMLAHRFRRPIATIQLALSTFQKLGMIELDAKNYIKITNWEKHQNIEGLTEIREGNKIRKRRQRLREKGVPDELIKELEAAPKHKCSYCGKEIKDTEVTMDLIIPIEEGGKNEADNLVFACKECSEEKKDMSLEDFLNSKVQGANKDGKIKHILENPKLYKRVKWSGQGFTGTSNVTSHVTPHPSHALDIESDIESEIELELEEELERERDIDLDTDKDLEKEKELGFREPKGSSYHSDNRQTVDRPPKKDPEGSLSPLKGDATVGTPKPKGDFLQQVIDRWNAIDPNIPKVLAINQGTNRIKLLRARYNQYGPDAVFRAIDNVGKSTFLKGYAKDWVITFDWFIKPNNFIKVLEGNYDDMPNGSSKLGATKKEREFMDDMANAMAWAEDR